MKMMNKADLIILSVLTVWSIPLAFCSFCNFLNWIKGNDLKFDDDFSFLMFFWPLSIIIALFVYVVETVGWCFYQARIKNIKASGRHLLKKADRDHDKSLLEYLLSLKLFVDRKNKIVITMAFTPMMKRPKTRD